MSAPGRVLVVDDDRTTRKRMGLSVKALGHDWAEAEDGPAALALIESEDFDLVLLDIVMPGMDGFEVLERMRGARGRPEVPVLVVSGLDDDMASVARAIEMGAEDFLPKSFDPVLFRARVTSCIEKKRLRQNEVDTLRRVDQLAGAAAVMESGRFHPEHLGLEAVAAREDALGRLADVFMEMAAQVYDRERALQQRIRTQKGGLLLLVEGLVWGLVVPLSILIYAEIPQSAGVTLWMNLLAGILCLVWAAARGTSLRVTRPALGFIVAWSLLYGASSILLFEAAGRVSGIILSIIMALQGFAVFLIAALVRIEQPTARRFAGLGLGLTGVLAILLTRGADAGLSGSAWLLVAVAIPVLYGLIDILIATRNPPGLDQVVASGWVLVLSGLLFLPLAAAQGQLFLRGTGLGLGEGLMLVAALAVAVATVTHIYLIATAGAVFGSQSAYAITVAGIGWSVILLGESLTPWTLLTLGVVVAGLALVGPKREAADVKVEFVRRSRGQRTAKARAAGTVA